MKKTRVYLENQSEYYQLLKQAVVTNGACLELTCLDCYAGVKILVTDTQYDCLAGAQKDEVNNWLSLNQTVLQRLQQEKLPSVVSIGSESVFAEKIGGGQRLIICGAGHVSLALVRVAKMIGFYTIVIDDRFSFCDAAYGAGADEVICESYAKALPTIDDSDLPYFVIVTRGHQYDVDCMHAILGKQSSYVGMMGSKVRVAQLKKSLIAEGYDEKRLDAVHMPIGLRIGAQSPEEIAISIVGELIACRHQLNETYDYSKEMMQTLTNTDLSVRAAMAVIIRKRGCGPRNAGTKMLILEDGRLIGTIGGGCAEASVITKARACMHENSCTIEHVDMTNREAAENGMVCGGIMDVFIQPL